MPSPIISFRFTDSEVESLEALKQPHESISQCAARLLRETLGLSLQGVDIEQKALNERLEALLEKRFSHLVNEVNALRFRVEALETTTPSEAKPKRTSSRQKSTKPASEASK